MFNQRLKFPGSVMCWVFFGEVSSLFEKCSALHIEENLSLDIVSAID